MVSSYFSPGRNSRIVQSFRLLNRVFSVTGQLKYASFLMGVEECKNIHVTNVTVKDVSQEVVTQLRMCLKSLVEATICLAPSSGANETISMTVVKSEENKANFPLTTAVWHKLSQLQCPLSTSLYRVWSSW